MTAGDRDLADRGSHIVDRNGDEPLGDLFERTTVVERVGDLGQPRPCRLDIERLVAVRPEHRRKMARVDPPQHEVAVGHRQWPAGAVTGRPRLCAGRSGPDPEAHPVIAADRPAARGDSVHLHHRRADSDPRDDAFLGQLEPPGIMRHVGRGAAHVEPDQPRRFAVREMRAARRDHSDNPASRTGQQGILAAKRRGVGQPAVGLHELQRSCAEPAGDAVDVAAQDRRQIGIDHGRVAAWHQFDQRRDLVADRDLSEAEIARDGCQPRLMVGIAPAVHQDDGNGVVAVVAECLECVAGRRFVERPDDRAIRADPLVDLNHRFVEHRRQNDVPREDVGPRLGADPERIAKSARDRQRNALALAFEQGVGCDGGAHPHRAKRSAFLGEDPADAFERGIGIASRIVRQQFHHPLPPVAVPRDDIGERPAAIDRKSPAGVHRLIKQNGGLCSIDFRGAGLARSAKAKARKMPD